MAADQLNFNYSDYQSDDGNTYCLRAAQEWISASGNPGGSVSPCTSDKAYGRATKRRAPRKAIWRDGTTFRTKTTPVFTPTAFDALTIGTSTLDVHVPGETAAVTYTLVHLVAEKRPSTVVGRQAADHA